MMPNPYNYSLDFSPIQMGLQSIQQGNIQARKQEQEDRQYKLLEEQQLRDRAVQDRNRQFQEYQGSDDYSSEEALKMYPDKLEEIQLHGNYLTGLREAGGQDFSRRAFDAADRGDKESVFKILDANSDFINNSGDQELSVDRLKMMYEEDTEIFKDIAADVFVQSGGKRKDLEGAKRATSGTFKTQDTGGGIAVLDTRTGEVVKTLPKTTQPRLFKIQENPDGSITKHYSDGTEEKALHSEFLKTPDMNKPMSYTRAQKVMSDAKEYQTKSAGFALRLRDSIDAMKSLTSPEAENQVSPERVAFIGKALGDGSIANFQLAPEEQEYLINAKDALFAILRPETGAAITDQELAQYGKIYLPQPGDSKKATKTKLKKLEGQFNSLRARSPIVYDASKIIVGDGPTLRVKKPQTPQPPAPGQQDFSQVTDDQLIQQLNLAN